ncbi:hypothetical protein AMK59_7322, partial [Oryctes borbonicus]
MESELDQESYSAFAVLTNILQNYGWYILIVTAVSLYIVSLFKPKIKKYLEWRSEQEYTAKYHKNPDILTKRLGAQQKRVMLLQEQYQRDSEIHQEKLKEREAKRLDEIAKKYENVTVGERLGSSKDGTTKSLKPEYHPLMGDSSRSYRPARKSPCSGGGCG